MSEASAAVPLAAGGSGEGGGADGGCTLMRHDLGLYAVAAPLGARPVAVAFAFEALIAAIEAPSGVVGTEELRATILDAQGRWQSRVAEDASLRGLGCCLAAIVRREDHVIVAHLGDCGVLAIRGADVVEATRDHTTRTEPDRRHPEGRRVILRAFGMDSNPEVHRWSVEPRDRIVLTAEVRRHVPDHEIAEVASAANRASDVVSALLGRALERGAAGDVSAIVLFGSGRAA
jgi:serine/threonine protein phosphatase PrpC